MYIYVIINKAWPEYVKIGRTYNVQKRLKGYQTQCPLKDYEIYYYTETNNIVELENIFIKLYGKDYGEWYKIDKDYAVSLIKENLIYKTVEVNVEVNVESIEYKSETIYNCYEFNNCKIDFINNICLDREGAEHKLNEKEISFLKLLTENEGVILTREHILKTVYSIFTDTKLRSIDNHITKYRKLFELDSRNPLHFFSIRGVGYKFVK